MWTIAFSVYPEVNRILSVGTLCQLPAAYRPRHNNIREQEIDLDPAFQNSFYSGGESPAPTTLFDKQNGEVAVGAGGFQRFGGPRVLRRGGRSRFAPTPPRVLCDYFRSRRGQNGFPRSSEADLLCQRRTSLRIGWRDDLVISRQLPAGAICRRFQPMSVAEMPAQHQAAKPAFEADNMLVLHRSPDRNRRRQGLGRGHRRSRAETTERAVHHCDQPR